MKKTMPKWLNMLLKFAVPAVVSVGLCVVMFRDIDFREMIGVIRRDCDFRWIGLNLAIGLLPMVFRGLRWGIQLRTIGVNAPVRILVLSMFGTYAVNIVFPRLGEIWRTGYISVRQEKPFSEVFGSMIADRLADTVTVALLTLATFYVARGPIVEFVHAYPQAYEAIGRVLSSPLTWGTLVAGCVGLWALFRFSRNAWVVKTKKFFVGLFAGFAGIWRMKGKVQWLALTVAIWTCYYMQLYFAFYAFPMTREMLALHGPTLVLVCFVLTSISMGIPSNGGIGPYQTALLFGLGMFAPAGMPRTEFLTTGAAFGNVVIASQTCFLVVLGLVTFLLIALDRNRRKAVGNPDPNVPDCGEMNAR